MQKQKENLFLDKFRLLNSQEHTDEIIWSPSDSSEYEESTVNEKFSNITNKTRNLKRKRKKKAHNNLQNLSITVLDTSKDRQELQNGETSPILVSKNNLKSFCNSPILPTTQSSFSPVLPSRSLLQKSPILTLKRDSPQHVGNIKKNLFSHQKNEQSDTNSNSFYNINIKTEIDSDCEIENNLSCRSSTSDHSTRVKEENTSIAKLELVGKVKSFFDSHFSSESSQNSQPISDIQTQKDSTKTSVEILSKSISNSSLSIKSTKESGHSSENSFYIFNKTKKVRYKKDGLAYRLNNLLRKQNACVSLWQHERFLAANSNFVIPKGENSVFRIQKVNFKYGCYLIEAVDLNDFDYLVLINGCYVSDNIINNNIIKVYKPFKVVQYNKDTKMIINVCRFECSHMEVT